MKKGRSHCQGNGEAKVLKGKTERERWKKPWRRKLGRSEVKGRDAKKGDVKISQSSNNGRVINKEKGKLSHDDEYHKQRKGKRNTRPKEEDRAITVNLIK